MSISYSYFSTVIWKYVVFQQGAPRRDDVVAWKHFYLPESAAPLHHYHSMSVIHRKKKILFRSIVFWIKNFYKHIDITPSVPLLHLLVTRPVGRCYGGPEGVACDIKLWQWKRSQ